MHGFQWVSFIYTFNFLNVFIHTRPLKLTNVIPYLDSIKVLFTTYLLKCNVPTEDLLLNILKVTVDLQGCLPKNHSYARRLCYNHRKVYITVKLIKCKIRRNKHF